MNGVNNNANKQNKPIYITIGGKNHKVTVIHTRNGSILYELKLPLARGPSHRPRRKDYRKHSLEELTDAINKDLAAGVLRQPDGRRKKITVSELSELYAQDAFVILQASTRSNYRIILRRIRRSLGSRYAADVTASLVTTCCLAVQQESVQQNHAKDGASAANDFHFLLSRIMDFGVRLGFIRDNPCKYAPTIRPVRKVNLLPGLKEIRDYLHALDEEGIYGDALAVTLLLGIRVGETLALTLDKVDWDGGSIQISSHIVYIPCDGHSQNVLLTGRKMHDEYKTALTEAVSDYIRRALKRRRKWEADPESDYHNENDLIFTNECGASLLYNTVRRHHDSAVARAGIPPITIHDLRRIYASYLFNQTYNLHLVMNALGQASPEAARRYIRPTTDSFEEIRRSQEHFHQAIMNANARKPGSIPQLHR